VTLESVPLSVEDLEFAVGESERFPSHRSEIISAVLAALLISRFRAGPLAQPTQTDVKHETPEWTVTELFARLRPTQDIDKVLAGAYFLSLQEQKHLFTSDDIRKCLHAGKMPCPANISLAILANARKGFLGQSDKAAGKRNSWFITQSGLAAIERRFNSSGTSHEKLKTR
jgi:hypothetical protein